MHTYQGWAKSIFKKQELQKEKRENSRNAKVKGDPIPDTYVPKALCNLFLAVSILAQMSTF